MSPQLYLGGYPTDIIYILIYLFISIIPCFMQGIIDHSRTHWLTTVTIELILTLWLWQWLRVAVSIQLYCELWCCLLLLLSCYVEQATMCKTYISLFLDEVAKGSPTKLATPQELWPLQEPNPELNLLTSLAFLFVCPSVIQYLSSSRFKKMCKYSGAHTNL